jgi:hypothetical protein
VEHKKLCPLQMSLKTAITFFHKQWQTIEQQSQKTVRFPQEQASAALCSWAAINNMPIL